MASMMRYPDVDEDDIELNMLPRCANCGDPIVKRRGEWRHWPNGQEVCWPPRKARPPAGFAE